MSSSTLDRNEGETGSAMTREHSDLQRVKTAIEGFRDLFMALLELSLEPKIESIQSNVQQGGTIPEDQTVITLLYNQSQTAIGRDVFPENTSCEWQTTIMKHSECDNSVYVFLPSMTSALRKIGARVDWLAIGVLPSFDIRFAYPGDVDEYEAPLVVRHSIFVITAETEEQFIADFTLEQFGFDGSGWIRLKDEYVDDIALPETCRLLTDEEIESCEEIL